MPAVLTMFGVRGVAGLSPVAVMMFVVTALWLLWAPAGSVSLFLSWLVVASGFVVTAGTVVCVGGLVWPESGTPFWSPTVTLVMTESLDTIDVVVLGWAGDTDISGSVDRILAPGLDATCSSMELVVSKDNTESS